MPREHPAAQGRLGLQVQTVVNREERELQAIGDAKLVENIVKMILHGLFGDEHLLGNFLVLIALGDEDDDLALTLAQLRAIAGCFAASRCGGAVKSGGAANCRMTAAVVLASSQISPSLTLWMLFAISDAGEFFRRMPAQPSFMASTNSSLLSDAVKRTTLTRAERIAKLRSTPRPFSTRQVQLHQHHVGVRGANQIQGFNPILRLTDNGDVGLCSEYHDQVLPGLQGGYRLSAHES